VELSGNIHLYKGFSMMQVTRYGLMALSVLLVATLGLVGCSGEEKKAEQAPQGPVPMKVIKSEAQNMPYWGEFVGQTSAAETVEIRARVAGYLQERKFDEGTLVKKGDLLFVIDPRPFQEDLKQAQSGLEYNRALYKKAKKDLDRFAKLFDEGVVSRDEYEGYQTEVSTYKAQVSDNRAKVENARIQLGYTKIYAPMDGVIGRVNVNVGNLVGQGENTLLATVSSQDPVYVSFSISETDYIRAQRNPEMKEGGRPIKLILADGSEYSESGQFDMVNRAIDSQTGTLGIRVIFPNPDNLLRPGQYAKVRVLIAESKDAVVIPTRGVMDIQGMKSLFVVGEDGTVTSKPVKLGYESHDLVIINEGLEAGEMVIVDGIRRVKPGMKIKPIVVPMQKEKGEPVKIGGEQGGDKAEAKPASEAKAE